MYRAMDCPATTSSLCPDLASQGPLHYWAAARSLEKPAADSTWDCWPACWRVAAHGLGCCAALALQPRWSRDAPAARTHRLQARGHQKLGGVHPSQPAQHLNVEQAPEPTGLRRAAHLRPGPLTAGSCSRVQVRQCGAIAQSTFASIHQLGDGPLTMLQFRDRSEKTWCSQYRSPLVAQTSVAGWALVPQLDVAPASPVHPCSPQSIVHSNPYVQSATRMAGDSALRVLRAAWCGWLDPASCLREKPFAWQAASGIGERNPHLEKYPGSAFHSTCGPERPAGLASSLVLPAAPAPGRRAPPLWAHGWAWLPAARGTHTSAAA
mmetsp:Transcript_29577/g.75876  ORF Transcript_29577/g.75876 Transcript_29577/m.75876 type:complete len:322 (+) Transcript_29577:294-1259(+)